jgi:hypothetical protein
MSARVRGKTALEGAAQGIGRASAVALVRKSPSPAVRDGGLRWT